MSLARRSGSEISWRIYDVPSSSTALSSHGRRVHGVRSALGAPVESGPQSGAQAGDRGERAPQHRRKRDIGARQHPGRGALIQLQFTDPPDDLGHQLDGAGAGPDDGDPLTGQLDVVVPLCRMGGRAGELIEAFDVGNARDVQRAGPGDEELGDVLPVGVGEHVPAVLVVVPVGPVDPGVEVDVRPQAVLVGDALEVVEDLRLVGEQLFPIRFRLKGERVQVGGNVAGTAGIGVRCRRPRRPSPG